MDNEVDSGNEAKDANAGMCLVLCLVLAAVLFPEHIIAPAMQTLLEWVRVLDLL